MPDNFNNANFTGRTPRTLQESKFGPYAEMECYRCEGDDMAFSRWVWAIGTASAVSVCGFILWVLL